MRLLRPGDEVIATHDLYGGAYRLFTQVVAAYGIHFHFVDLSDSAAIRQKLNARTRMIWMETPTNPTLKILDIRAVVEQVCGQHIWVAVDNTFASPYLQNPLELGADIVMHALTKYIAGHSDLLMGAVIVRDPELAERLAFIQNTCGAIPGPQDCFLTLRGIKTLALRMQRHCENGRAVAEFLAAHPAVQHVYWPGLEDHPGHVVAKAQMRDFGGMLSFRLVDDRVERALALMRRCRLFALAESLGGVESLIGHPVTMTHGSIPKAAREAVGITDSLIRLSVGIEDAEDLIADLEQALAGAH
ncbi:Cys/Met metabolism pyridoxal-phosphate-dependent protein [Nitritalea halalkaliphila LW7]|uniref:L-methionine gamma-lyase n=1 Tax=Nitritalea halalkaliphila LW7 TaxID=1189621 RepID=I5BSP2_9BACT|nr:Cys/Met metabolism pyridoxal-phosphate-dependent protein [Nitritalea halalkaliphila LW7]